MIAAGATQPSDERAAGRLVMRGISKSFGATRALDGVDLAVAGGEVRALVGENGAGKSTLMKILAGAIAPDSGAMTLYGDAYRPRDPADGRRRGVAMIYQELSIAPDLSVAENVLLGAEPRLGPMLRRSELERRAREALTIVGREQLPLGARAGSLSIAEQQLVEVARAVSLDSGVFVLDEPTSSLSAPDVARLFDLVRRLRDRGEAVIYISHALEEIEIIADTYTVLRDGSVTGEGRVADVTRDALVALMVGRPVQQLFARSHHAPGEVVVSVAGLSGKRRPASASFELRRGEVLGIAGLIGAGRTELLRILQGLDPLVEGALRILELTGGASPRARWLSGVGLLSEDRKEEGLALDLGIDENLALPSLGRRGRFGMLTPASLRREAARWIEAVGVRCADASQAVGALSGGNQQKVAFARLLSADVDVLLLDEPTRGVDVGAKAVLYQLINEAARGDRERGIEPKAVLMVSSELPELLGACDRIAVMRDGCLGPARPASEWSERSLLSEATSA